MSETTTDVALIGAGPIGLEMAVALKQAKIDYVQFDAHQVGYTISWFAPQTRFFSSNERIAIAGVPLNTADQTKATREDYLAYLRRIVLQFDLPIRTFEPVHAIRRANRKFILESESRGRKFTTIANKVILSTGGTASPRRINVPGEDLPHVSHYFQDPHAYFRRTVLIVGGKNSAVEAAIRCYHADARVVISYRREQFNVNSIKYWLLPEINGLIKEKKIEAHFNTTVCSIEPDAVTLSSGARIEADFVLLLTGYEADMSLFVQAGVELSPDRQVPLFDEHTMETNIPDLYVIGTAIAGTQERYSVFLENCHVHVKRVMSALQGQSAPIEEPATEMPET